MFADPADSGQDYGVIEEAGGMSARVVVDDDDGWKLVDDERYTGR
jgi:glucose-6-phosphate isomerase